MCKKTNSESEPTKEKKLEKISGKKKPSREEMIKADPSHALIRKPATKSQIENFHTYVESMDTENTKNEI